MNDAPADPPKLSDRFRQMADRIDHNEASGFAGAVLIVPPPGGGDVIEMLVLDPQPDVAQFYSTLATRIQNSLTNLDTANRQARAFGR